MKTLFLVRHCKAAGQEPDAPLTAEGLSQALSLAASLADLQIERVISSPYRRAIQSIEPLAAQIAVDIEIDERLVERVLCPEPVTNWQSHLERSFHDMDYALEDGESSHQAMQRAVAVLDEAHTHSAQTVLLVIHGNLMTLFLKHFDDSFGFSAWQELTNPDIYQVVFSGTPKISHIALRDLK
jgi:2,3-bisphosphoglycerate-dependent phosphoglycerate mutase